MGINEIKSFQQLYNDIQLLKKYGIIIKIDEDAFVIRIDKKLFNKMKEQENLNICWRDLETDRVFIIRETYD